MKLRILLFITALALSPMALLTAAQRESVFGPSPINLAGVRYPIKKTFIIGDEIYTFVRTKKDHHLPHQEFTQLVYNLITRLPEQRAGWRIDGGTVTLTLESKPNGDVFLTAVTTPLVTCHSRSSPQKITALKLPVHSAQCLINDSLYLFVYDQDNPIVRILRKSLTHMLDKLLLIRDQLESEMHMMCAKCQEPIYHLNAQNRQIGSPHTYLGTCKHAVHTEGCSDQCLKTRDQEKQSAIIASKEEEKTPEPVEAQEKEEEKSPKQSSRLSVEFQEELIHTFMDDSHHDDTPPTHYYQCPDPTCQAISSLDNIFSID